MGCDHNSRAVSQLSEPIFGFNSRRLHHSLTNHYYE